MVITENKQAETTKRFELEFDQKMYFGQNLKGVQQFFHDWSVSYKRIERKDFGQNSITSEAGAPDGAVAALIGTTKTLERSAMFETFAQVVVYLDEHDAVIHSRYNVLTAGP